MRFWLLALLGLFLGAPEQAAVAPYAAERIGDVVELRDERTDTRVSIAPGVGNVAFALSVKGHNLLHWPYASIAEFKARPSLSGIPLLAPWANRLDEAAFFANGKRYAFDMSLGNVRGPVPIHGLVAATDRWQVVDLNADGRSAWVTATLDFGREAAWMKQWPFAHTITTTYRLQDGGLEVRTAVTNSSAEPMPLAIGYHPYLRLTDSPREAWTISVGARGRWLLSPAKLPTGETEPITRLFPDPSAAALAEYNLDDVFGNLERDREGRATMSVKGKSQALDVIIGPKFRAVVIYAPRERNFICFEPMAGITNAINLAHKGLYGELQSVAPGQTWQESFWLQPRGF